VAVNHRNVRVLGRTDLQVSAVSAGCWAIAGGACWGEQDETAAVDALRTALDVGITFFDTAEAYGSGSSEELLGKALADRRDEIVIGSKADCQHAIRWDDLRAACEDSLRRLRTDRIDVYHLHWPNRDVPVDNVAANFERLKADGKIRHFAVSNFGPGDLGDLLNYGRCEANQVPYSLLWRAIEYDILPLCLEHQIAITCYSPLVQGLLTGKFRTPDEVPEMRARTRHFSCDRPKTRHHEPGCEDLTFATLAVIGEIAADAGLSMTELALGWLLEQRGVASVIVGLRNPDQARAAAAAMDQKLGSDTLVRLTAATDELKQVLGSNPDLWQSESRYR